MNLEYIQSYGQSSVLIADPIYLREPRICRAPSSSQAPSTYFITKRTKNMDRALLISVSEPRIWTELRPHRRPHLPTSSLSEPRIWTELRPHLPTSSLSELRIHTELGPHRRFHHQLNQEYGQSSVLFAGSIYLLHHQENQEYGQSSVLISVSIYLLLH